MTHTTTTNDIGNQAGSAAGKEQDRDEIRGRRLRGDEAERIRDELGRVRTDRIFAPRTRAAHLARASQFQLLFDFAIETCARLEELASAHWRDIDLQRRLWLAASGRSYPKTRRKVYLTPRASEILQELWGNGSFGCVRVFHRLPAASGVGKAFERALDNLGIEGLKFRDLKHEGMRRHLEAGLFEPNVLMRMVGYSGSDMFARYLIPSDAEVFAGMELALLGSHLPALPIADATAREAPLAARLHRLLRLMDANALDMGADPALVQARLAAQLRECLEPTPKQPLRL